MLNYEERFIIKCLSDMINEIPTKKPTYDIDMSKVKILSDSQSLSEIIYYQCNQWLNETDMYHEFKKSIINEAYISQNRKYLLKQIAENCRNKNIDLIVMKGSVFRNYYPENELRNMGDIDLVIMKKDLEVVDTIMTELGYDKYIDNHSVWTYNLNKFEFEIHNQMFYETLTNNINYIDYFNHVWENKKHEEVFNLECENLYVPNDEFHFLYLMVHTAKHIINKGTGFRPFIDMVLMIKKCNMDMEHIKQELIKLKLYDFCCMCFSLCEYWFGFVSPFENEKCDQEFCDSITKKALRDGLFGLDNEENIVGSISKEIKKSEHNYSITSIHIIIRKIFPPYEDMQLIKAYKFVDGKRYLMPFAWIYRWIYCLFKKPIHSIKLITRPYIKKDEIKNREILLKKWGL